MQIMPGYPMVLFRCVDLMSNCWKLGHHPLHIVQLHVQGPVLYILAILFTYNDLHLLVMVQSLELKLRLSIQFQLSSILPDWSNLIPRWRLYYSLKYKLLADTKRSRFLCVRSVGAVVHVFVLPVGEHYRS
jgi:hypothetical protein